ncbi:DNA-processing protein DprA [Lagierella sp.]|uniref:DNA-processing protein DprA n=1 Tax=Lagierella sp. TaxID=2849657 RepID=UPI00262E208F|nr:DNA-processing protein DprA [Lagierella sp.]
MDKNLVLFCNILSISNPVTIALLEKFTSYKEFIANIPDLNEILNLDKRTVNKIIKNRDLNLNEYLEKLKKLGISMTFFGDDDYPENLNYIDDPPLMLYYMGTLSKEDGLGLSIVGSRKCTSYGAWACKELAYELSRNKIPIISGLAYGIDRIAHEVSLENNNRTVAVIGNGLDIVYPYKHKELYKKIVNNGVIFSEYALGVEPLHYNFPYRNRIISGIGQGVVVIEAQKKSGTLITANYAADQGKDVFALPGNINSFYSVGTNDLIKDGAKIITDVDDILEEIHCPNKKQEEVIQLTLDDPIENNIINLLISSPCTCDIISNQLGLPIDEVNANLTKLEMKGYVIEEIGGVFYPVVQKG